MPRKDDVFTTISIEKKTKKLIEANRYPGEPIYNTVFRLVMRYEQSDIKDAQYMINEYQQIMRKQKEKIDIYESQITNNLERYI